MADSSLVAGDTVPGAAAGRQRWDVALSFAGEDRAYVQRVAAALTAQGVSCFYDADHDVRLWGKDLVEELARIYLTDATTVVLFISAAYAAKEWTRLERRAALARALGERREYVLPVRFDDTDLPGLLPTVKTIPLAGTSPERLAELIVAKLNDLTNTGSVRSADGDSGPARASSHPAGAIRVGQADPRRLGVHPAIQVAGVSDEIPPAYVDRDVDRAEQGVRAKLAAAAGRGGFVLLVGGSSSGKTRCAYEAVKALLPDWWLVHPAGPEQVVALARRRPGQTVVWLDETQRYLDGEHALTGGVVRALLNAPDPAVVVGTLWPDRYSTYTALPVPGGADPHARERELLGLADVIRIGGEFSPAEQARARQAAGGDQRLQVALYTAGYGLTQTLAAAPQLVAHWEDAVAAEPYGWAVITAALDAARLGARAPLLPGLLRAAAVGYCTPRQQAEAPADWFEHALAYATRKLHGAAAVLEPVGAGMGRLAGYTAADYLDQHAIRTRRAARVPASTWEALLDHVSDAADLTRLAYSAKDRLLYRYAILLYRRAADAGHRFVAYRADELAERGNLAEQLWERAEADRTVDGLTAKLLAERGDIDKLRARADAGDHYDAYWLVELLAKRGDLAELGARADAGDWHAADWLVDLLTKRGDQDGAIEVLRARVDAGDPKAAHRLAGLLARLGRGEEAWRLRRFGLNPDGSIASGLDG